jgi:tetratricopeptide (TPR) repeat protein
MQLASGYAASQPELAAQALYVLGAKDWYADRNQEAKQIMQRILTTLRTTSWADDAHYVIGRIFQSQHAYSVAAQWYTTLQKRYPASALAEESLWRAGWSYYLARQYLQAARTFSRAIRHFLSGFTRNVSTGRAGVLSSNKIFDPQLNDTSNYCPQPLHRIMRYALKIVCVC